MNCNRYCKSIVEDGICFRTFVHVWMGSAHTHCIYYNGLQRLYVDIQVCIDIQQNLKLEIRIKFENNQSLAALISK